MTTWSNSAVTARGQRAPPAPRSSPRLPPSSDRASRPTAPRRPAGAGQRRRRQPTDRRRQRRHGRHSLRGSGAPGPGPAPEPAPRPRHTSPHARRLSASNRADRKGAGHDDPAVHAQRRTYLIGKARPNAIVGKNRETGEIALIIVGAALGMLCGLLIPILPLRIGGLGRASRCSPSPPSTSPTGAAPSTAGSRSTAAYRRTLRAGATYRSSAMEAGHPARRARGRDRPAAGYRPDQLARRTRSARTRSPSCCTSTAGPSPPPSRSRAPVSACATARTRRRWSTGSARC